VNVGGGAEHPQVLEIGTFIEEELPRSQSFAGGWRTVPEVVSSAGCLCPKISTEA
jgi:hypothetical protein